MGTSDPDDERTVEVDDRGRVTIPKPVRERFRLAPGDELGVAVDEGEIHLSPVRAALTTATSENAPSDWGEEAFPDSGEATFGGRPSDGR